MPNQTCLYIHFSLNTSFLTQVEFSDESDPEADPKAELKAKAEVSKKRTTTRSRRAPETPAPQAPVKTPRRKKSTAVARAPSSEDEAAAAGPVRRGRGRRPLAGSSETGKGEEPEKMRTIDEELDGVVLDLSIEQLRASDTEDDAAASRDLFVLPRLFFVAGLIRIFFVFN